MTFRELLASVDLAKVYKYINKKDSKSIVACDRPSMERTIDSYTRVVNELMQKPKARKYSMSIFVQESTDFFDKKKYADVCFLNPKYIAPPKGLKPWGGKNPPKGYYNVNDNKYSRIFATGWTPWSKIIDTPVINDAGYPLEKLLAEILWELTFYGWTEKKVKVHVKEISEKIKKAHKEIEAGKCIELPPKKRGGYKIVIPDSVSQQIIDIANKPKRK